MSATPQRMPTPSIFAPLLRSIWIPQDNEEAQCRVLGQSSETPSWRPQECQGVLPMPLRMELGLLGSQCYHIHSSNNVGSKRQVHPQTGKGVW